MGRKVLVAQFVTESNANIPYKTDLENYDLRFGEDAISQMNMGTVFADAGIEVVPSVYANGFSGGVVTRNAFDYIENRLLNDIRANLGTLDGMFRVAVFIVVGLILLGTGAGYARLLSQQDSEL